MVASRDRSDGRLFDRAATSYAEARPGYPLELYELLRTQCDLRAGSRVLEVGAGTGQATRALLDLGAELTAVEPGESLASYLSRLGRPPHLQVIVSTFEEANIAPASFDIVVSATAFHWVDPHVGIPKVASALRQGGALAVWATLYGDPDLPDPFHDALQPILEAEAPELIAPRSADRATAPRGLPNGSSSLSLGKISSQ